MIEIVAVHEKNKAKRHEAIKKKKEDQEIIKQKLLKPIYNGCNDSFYLLWKNKHDEYVNKCFNEKNK